MLILRMKSYRMQSFFSPGNLLNFFFLISIVCLHHSLGSKPFIIII
uniref:Uncharacterized protein n=1 Tax=Rhizophora mucronata TaxID=61149 RepID=A0A2P2NBJ1_RHIMU